MQLRKYLKLNCMTYPDFANLLQVSEHGVGKWVRGERIPRPKILKKIEEITAGKVGPSDFYEAA